MAWEDTPYRELLSGLAIILIAVFHVFFAPPTRVADDFYQFWVVGRAISTMEVQNVYDGGERSRIRKEFYNRARSSERSSHELRAIKVRRNLRPAGTPFFYAVFDLVSTGRYDKDYRNFRMFSAFCFIAGVVYFARLRGLSLTETAVILVAFTFLSLAYRLEVRSANVNQFQVGALAFLMYLRRRPLTQMREALSGFFLTSVVLFKPNLYIAAAAIGLLWLFHGNRRSWQMQAAGAGAGVALALLLPLVLFGGACTWPNWVDGYREIASRPYYVDTSFPGFLFPDNKWTAARAVGLLAIAVPVALTLLPGVSWPDDRRERREEALALGLGVGGYLLSAPLVHGHYFVLVAPLLIMLMPSPHDRLQGPARWRIWTRRAVLIAAFALIANPHLLSYRLTSKETHSFGTYAGCLMLYILAVRDLSRIRTGGDLESRRFA